MKKYRKRLTFFVIILCISSTVKAQQDAIDGFFMLTPLRFNPAIVGTTDRMIASALYRNQWNSIEGAPTNFYVAASAPVFRTVAPRENMYTVHYPTGISSGLTIEQDKIGISKFTKFSIPIGVRVRVGKKGGRFSLGIKPNLNIGSSDITELIQDSGETFNSDWKKSYINFDVGLYFYNTRWYVSGSVTNILDESVLYDYGYKQEDHYYLSGGYVFGLSQKLLLRTAALLTMVSNSPVSFTFSPGLIIDNKLICGLAYRHKDMLGLNAIYNISNNIRLGYAYEYPTGVKSQKIGGTHEVMVQYVFNKKDSWVISPRYFW